ncbi:helix-turn-helix domain-containing protein [Streptomyces rochei]
MGPPQGVRVVGADDKYMQSDAVAAQTEPETGLVTPSACSHSGFRLCTEPVVRRLTVIRRMKPLGTLEQVREAHDAVERLGRAETPGGAGREALLEQVRSHEKDASRKIEELRIQLTRAEDFAATLRARPGAACSSRQRLGLAAGHPSAPRTAPCFPAGRDNTSVAGVVGLKDSRSPEFRSSCTIGGC